MGPTCNEKKDEDEESFLHLPKAVMIRVHLVVRISSSSFDGTGFSELEYDIAC